MPTIESIVTNDVVDWQTLLLATTSKSWPRERSQKLELPKYLDAALTDSNILVFLHSKAKEFIRANRPYEYSSLEQMFPEYPRDCFLNLYDTGVSCGIRTHSDHVSFCTVVFCLKGNGEGNLYLTNEYNEIVNVQLFSDDLVTFARIIHGVDISTRTDKRITLNAFF